MIQSCVTREDWGRIWNLLAYPLPADVRVAVATGYDGLAIRNDPSVIHDCGRFRAGHFSNGVTSTGKAEIVIGPSPILSLSTWPAAQEKWS